VTDQDRYRFAPDLAVPPGETLREVLAELHLSQADLANRGGISTKHINQIIQGLSPITYETALVLERVTGMPAAVWNRLEATYQETQLRNRQAELTDDDNAWLDSLPVKPLVRAGYLPATTSRGSLYQAALAFFGIADVSAWNRVWRKPVASFKRTRAFASHPGSVAAWLRIGEIEAREIPAQPFSKDGFRAALRQARALTRKREFLGELQSLCAAVGVVVIYVPEVDRCRISGATWWATPSRAVIQLSDRYKSDDQFWFAFFHEAAHVLLHSKKQTYIDDGSEDDTTEEEANHFAVHTLISQRDQLRLDTLNSIADVKAFAAEIGVSDGIVVGRLHHLKKWDWGKGRSLKMNFDLGPLSARGSSEH
jgi:HTH-type transcriptional regulator / antitoxin HigA